MNKKKPIIIDTDMAYGSKNADVDDCLALLVALNNPNFDVRAITAVGGNVPAEMASYNIDLLLKELDLSHIPHSYSQSQPLDSSMWVKNTRWQNREKEIPTAKLNLPTSLQLLEDTLENSSEKITIVAIGPLTNIGALIATRPDLCKKIESLCIMGGVKDIIGIEKLPLEFNVRCDPEAASLVFSSDKVKIDLFPLEVTKKKQLLPQDIKNWSETGFIKRVKDSLLDYMTFRSKRFEFDYPFAYYHDTLPLIYLTNPEYFEMVDCTCTLDTEGEFTRGSLIVDTRLYENKTTLHKIALDCDSESLHKIIVDELPRKWSNIK